MPFIDFHTLVAAAGSRQWLTLHGIFVLTGLLAYVLTTHSLQKRRSPSAAISWVLTIALMPYVGLPLYLMFGTRKLTRFAGHASAIVATPGFATDDAWARQLTAAMGLPPAVPYGDLHIHGTGTQALESLWKLIDSAQHELVLCTFLVGRDPIGHALIARIAEKARGGVAVRLLIDGVGRIMGGAPSLQILKAAGVKVALFSPILHIPFSKTTNLRNHRKMVVADRLRLWCGGRNFAAEYFEGTHHHAAWRDLSVDLTGRLAEQAAELFDRDWASATGSLFSETASVVPLTNEAYGQIIASGPDHADDTVHDLIVTACFKARGRVISATPYFVPGEALLMALSLAARRGVVVDLILPKRSNHRMADIARHRALRELTAAGARVWLVPYMLHAKAFVTDDTLAMCGSTNLDARSLFLNYELMVAFYIAADVLRFASALDAHKESARLYQARKPSLLKDLSEGLVLWLAFQL